MSLSHFVTRRAGFFMNACLGLFEARIAEKMTGEKRIGKIVQEK
jgi:hypothetical protein